MEMDVDAVNDTGDSELPDSGVPVAINGVLTEAGRRDQRAAQQRASSARALPLHPAARAAMEWDISKQRHQGKHASCRACCTEFASDELRFARSSDSRAGSSRYLHAACVPGGVHPQDTFTGTARSEQESVDLVASFRGSPESEETRASPVILPDFGAMGGDAWWERLPWDAASLITTGTLIDVPGSTRMAFALFKGDIIGQCLSAGITEEASTLWKKLSFIDSLILNSSRAEGESQSQSVVRRLQQASDGDWQSLLFEATSAKRRNISNSIASEEVQAKFVKDLALAGEPGRALKGLKKRLPIVRDASRTADVRSLFPPCEGPPLAATCPEEHQWPHEDILELASFISTQLMKKKKRKAPGPLGGRLEHWHVLQIVDKGAKDAGLLLANLALGLVPGDVVAAHARCELLPSLKPGGAGLRPLQLGSVCRRIAMGGLVKYVAAAVRDAVGPDQLAMGVPDGCAKAFQAIRSKCRQQPHRVVLAEDCVAAHQQLLRAHAASQLAKHCPKLMQPFLAWYGRVSAHTWVTARGDTIDVIAERGLDQGDPLANPVFNISLVDPAREMRNSMEAVDAEVAVIQMADDIQVCTVPGALHHAASELRRLWAPAGLSFSRDKQQTWSMSVMQLPEPFQMCRADQLRCLGNTLQQIDDNSEPTLPQIGADVAGGDLRLASEKVSPWPTPSSSWLSMDYLAKLVRTCFVMQRLARHNTLSLPVAYPSPRHMRMMLASVLLGRRS